MKILGITAEYNPFHNGHKYHIEQSKKETKADVCAVIMSGNFVQRGAPAVCDKWTRASWAVENGADIVFELPVVYSVATAETFAYGAISLMNAIKADVISFGSENSLSEIIHAYEIYKCKSEKFQISKELPFHTARTSMDNSLEILKKPNNILAFEYIKAIETTSSKVTPFSVIRSDNGYNSLDICKFSSASAIRNAIITKNDYSNTTPQNTEKYLCTNDIITENEFIDVIKYAVLTTKSDEIKNISEIREGLENKIISVIKENDFSDFESLVKKIKSKRYTYTAISRMLFQILLKITKADLTVPPQYLRVLAFNSQGQKLLKVLKENSMLPVITKPKDYTTLKNDGISMIKKDFLATDIYNLAFNKKGKADLTTSPIITS